MAHDYARMYPGWQAQINGLALLSGVRFDGVGGGGIGDPTPARAVRIAELRGMMHPVEDAARAAGAEIYEWLMLSVTKGVSFEGLQARGIPCGRGYFFRRRRMFYKILAVRLRWYDSEQFF